MSLTRNEPHKTDCSLFEFKHYLRACTITSERRLLILYEIQPIENHRGPTPDGNSH